MELTFDFFCRTIVFICLIIPERFLFACKSTCFAYMYKLKLCNILLTWRCLDAYAYKSKDDSSFEQYLHSCLIVIGWILQMKREIHSKHAWNCWEILGSKSWIHGRTWYYFSKGGAFRRILSLRIIYRQFPQYAGVRELGLIS